jgi:cystathionine beta-synthase
MKIYNNILETIGNTPLVKMNRIVSDVKATVLAKVETFNPGNSVKDRMALKMIEDAEKSGELKPGGTVIEGTSGNTGMGLALACVVKGYKLICTLSDKQSKEKMDILRAMGAEVIVCPTNVTPEDSRSYYSVARRLNQEIPNSVYVNQYDNLSNREAHYESTGPEIWEQTEGEITHFVVGVGTGGTISGVGKYLKEKNPNIKIWGIDTYGSVFKKYHETGIFDEKEIYPYITEGIGEDILPKNVDFSVIDRFEKVTDKDGAVYARKLALEEGLFLGYSAGSAIKGLLQLKDELTEDDVVVILFHDHGSRYVGKLFNDDWMLERGFLDKKPKTVQDILQRLGEQKLFTVKSSDAMVIAIDTMNLNNISQLPVVSKEGEFVGSLSDTKLFNLLVSNPDLKAELIEKVMQKPFPIVELSDNIEKVSSMLNNENTAVLVKNNDGKMQIITRQDIINTIC